MSSKKYFSSSGKLRRRSTRRRAAWLTAVSRQRAIDRLRQRKAEIDIQNAIIPVDATQFADAALQQIKGKISVILAQMPKKVRATFELAYIQGLTQSEISNRLG